MIRRLAPTALIFLLVATFTTRALATDPAAAQPDPSNPINLRRTVTVQVVQKTKDAVVNISTTKLVNQRVSPMGFDPFWQFGQFARVPASSLGSGFIVHKDGYVVTNNHVVDRARQISVELADGRKLPAELISTEPDADLAILRVRTDAPLPTLELGDSGDLMIGEPVIAVGNPLGFSHSVSTGIVSAIHRDIDPQQPQQPRGDEQPMHGEQAALRDLIQTDAAINPGNSGGPLLNAYGQVIGINTAIRGDAQNIGFAIPINRLRDLIPELMSPTQATKVELPIKLAERRQMTEPSTVTATITSADSEKKVLESINGEHPANIVDAYAMLLRLKADHPFEVTWAGYKPQKITPKATPTPDAIVQARQRFGLTIEAVTPMLAEKYHLVVEDGLLIDAVDRNSAAAKIRLQPGDIIWRLGGRPMRTLDDFASLVHLLPASGRIRVDVIRDDATGWAVLDF